MHEPHPTSQHDGMPQIPARTGPVRRVLSFVWAFMPVWSLGLLAPAPIVHAAARLRKRNIWLWVTAYVGAYVAVVTVNGLLPEDTEGPLSAVWFLGLVALVGGCTIHALLLRDRVFTPRIRPRLDTQAAYAAALHNRRQREESRALAGRDPALARDLRIGRPDLPRAFDDGGLVDANHVPAGVLVDRLGLAPGAAAKVVAARERLGGFGGANELSAYAELPPYTVDGFADLLTFLRY